MLRHLGERRVELREIRARRAGLAPGEFGEQPRLGQRRAQFVGEIAREAPLALERGQQAFQRGRQLAGDGRELARQVVAWRRAGAAVERQFRHRAAEGVERRQRAADRPGGEHQHQQQGAAGAGEQDAVQAPLERIQRLALFGDHDQQGAARVVGRQRHHPGQGAAAVAVRQPRS